MPPKSNPTKMQCGVFPRKTKVPIDFETLELESEVTELKKELRETETLLFETQKKTLKRRRFHKFPKVLKNTCNLHKGVKDTVEKADRARLETYMDLYLQTSGINVAYCDDIRCCIMFQVCMNGESIAKHAIEILKGTDSTKIGQCSMPAGFQYKAIAERYANICQEEFVLDVHSGLITYYSRMDQLRKLKEIQSNDVKLFYSSDGTMVELMFRVGHILHKWVINVCIRLSYEITDDRPSSIETQAQGLEPQYVTVLEEHLKHFLTLSLEEALARFKNDFSTEKGDFAIIVKEHVIDSTDKKSMVAKSRIQHSNEYLSDAELNLNETSHAPIHQSGPNLSMNNALWNLIHAVNMKPAVQTRKKKRNSVNHISANANSEWIKCNTKNINSGTVGKKITQSSAGPGSHLVDVNRLSHRSPRGKNHLRHLSLNSSKYVPSESDDSSETEMPTQKKPAANRLRNYAQGTKSKRTTEAVVASKSSEKCEEERLLIKVKRNIQAVHKRSERIRGLQCDRTAGATAQHTRVARPKKMRNETEDAAEEESEEDVLDIKERIEAISKVTKWLRSTPLPEGVS